MLMCSAAAFVLFWFAKARPKFLLRSLAAFFGASLLPLVGFLLYFHRAEDWRQSWRSVAFAWVPLLQTSVGKGFFYRWCLGLDTPALHIGRMLIQFLGLLCLLALCSVAFAKRLAKYRILPVA